MLESAENPTYNADNQDKRSTFDGEGGPTTYSNGIASSAFTVDPEDRLTGIASPSFAALYDGDSLRADRTSSGMALGSPV